MCKLAYTCMYTKVVLGSTQNNPVIAVRVIGLDRRKELLLAAPFRRSLSSDEQTVPFGTDVEPMSKFSKSHHLILIIIIPCNYVLFNFQDKEYLVVGTPTLYIVNCCLKFLSACGKNVNLVGPAQRDAFSCRGGIHQPYYYSKHIAIHWRLIILAFRLSKPHYNESNTSNESTMPDCCVNESGGPVHWSQTLVYSQDPYILVAKPNQVWAMSHIRLGLHFIIIRYGLQQLCYVHLPTVSVKHGGRQVMALEINHPHLVPGWGLTGFYGLLVNPPRGSGAHIIITFYWRNLFPGGVSNRICYKISKLLKQEEPNGTFCFKFGNSSWKRASTCSWEASGLGLCAPGLRRRPSTATRLYPTRMGKLIMFRTGCRGARLGEHQRYIKVSAKANLLSLQNNNEYTVPPGPWTFLGKRAYFFLSIRKYGVLYLLIFFGNKAKDYMFMK